MGNSPTCLGPQADLMVTFPTIDSISSAQALERDALGVQSTLTDFVSLPTSFVPGAGPFLVFLINFLGSTDFRDISAGFIRAQIHESILENDIIHYNAKITTIKNSLARLNRTDLARWQIQSEIIHALRGSEFLFNVAKDPNHLFSKYPVVSMPHFIRIMNILWATLQISSKLDPTLKVGNAATQREMSRVIRSFVNNFFGKRGKGISWRNCGFTIFSSQCLVYDRPWLKTRGGRWRDGIIIRGPGYGCHPESREYSSLREYKDASEYGSSLKQAYEKYFRNSFPVRY